MSAVKPIFYRLHPRRFERLLKRAVGAFLGLFLPRKRIDTVPLDTIQNILVVRQHNELGDMLCAVPLFRALRERFPSAYISLVASPVNYEVMQQHPLLDEIILYDKSQFRHSPGQFLKFYKKLKQRRYDLAIVSSTVSMSFTSDSMAYLCGAKYRIGAGSINGVENLAAAFFNFPLDLRWDLNSSVHQTERNLAYVRCIGLDTNDLCSNIHLGSSDKTWAKDFLCRHFKGKKCAIGFHPGAGKTSNRWPADRFARVAEKLSAALDALIIITHGPVDDEPAGEMVKNLKGSFIIVKEQSIRRVAALIDQLPLFVTNDTGMMHVAGATSTSVLSLFGPFDPYEWAPRGERHRFLASRNQNIDAIAEEDVYNAALELFQRR